MSRDTLSHWLGGDIATYRPIRGNAPRKSIKLLQIAIQKQDEGTGQSRMPIHVRLKIIGIAT